MQTNTLRRDTITARTHEGAPAARISAEAQLRRSVMSCMLWEDSFYESGVDIATRIAQLVPNVAPATVAEIALHARNEQHLRHAPLWLVNACLDASVASTHRQHVGRMLDGVIQRVDEIAEALSMYWRDGRRPIPKQLQRGLARAFGRFDAHQIAKYGRSQSKQGREVSLRDVMFLCHPSAGGDEERAEVYRRLAQRGGPASEKLKVARTWETERSAGSSERQTGLSADAKRDSWRRLLADRKMGDLALLRNLRTMLAEGVDRAEIRTALEAASWRKVLPFRFIAAAKANPQIEDLIEAALFAKFAGMPKIGGRTVLLVDVSSSMFWRTARLSERSEMLRGDAALGLAMIARELFEEVRIFVFGSYLNELPNRRGFALRDAARHTPAFNTGTNLGAAVRHVGSLESDRLIVVSDEQSHDRVPAVMGCKAYMLNVGTYQNGVSYGPWTHIDGWSDSCLRFIQELESTDRH